MSNVSSGVNHVILQSISIHPLLTTFRLPFSLGNEPWNIWLMAGIRCSAQREPALKSRYLSFIHFPGCIAAHYRFQWVYWDPIRLIYRPWSIQSGVRRFCAPKYIIRMRWRLCTKRGPSTSSQMFGSCEPRFTCFNWFSNAAYLLVNHFLDSSTKIIWNVSKVFLHYY